MPDINVGGTNVAGTCATDLTGVRTQVSPAEWQARLDCAATYRLIALFGMSDLVYTTSPFACPTTAASAS